LAAVEDASDGDTTPNISEKNIAVKITIFLSFLSAEKDSFIAKRFGELKVNHISREPTGTHLASLEILTIGFPAQRRGLPNSTCVGLPSATITIKL
jgi:hypothetical protein